MTRRIQERAHVLNAACARVTTAMAVVSSAEAERPDVEVAAYKCVACSVVFASNAGNEPFCVACGSHHVQATAGVKPETLPASEELAGYACASCDTYNIMSNARIGDLHGTAHCVLCGTVHNYFEEKAEADDGQEQQQDGGEQQQQDGGEGDEQQASADEGQQQDDAGDGGDDQDEQAPQQQQQQASGAGDEQLEVETVPLDDGEVLSDDSPAVQDGEELANISLTLAAAALAKNKNAEFALHHTGDTILATLDGLHVASLTPTEETAAMFTKAPFSQTILHVARQKGALAALDEFGFTKQSIEVPMTAAVNALVRRGVGEQTKALTDTTASLTGDLQQSLSIAALALNKSFWRSKSNPLKTAFAQTLAQLGVSNPNKLVARVFASAGDAYVKTLLECALDLSSKTVEFRNELAASLQDTEVQQESDGADADQDDADDGFEVPAKAVTASVTPLNPKPARIVAAQGVYAMREALGGSVFKR